MSERVWIKGSLWAGFVLSILMLIALTLWLLLGLLGDPGGSAGARGVFWVALVCWGLNLALLVVILALRTLRDDADTTPVSDEEL